MDNVYIVDDSTGEVVFDSEWPVITVKNSGDWLKVANDQFAVDEGTLHPLTFKLRWGIHPDCNYTVAFDC